MPIHSTENYRSWPHTCRPNRGRGKQKPLWDNPNWQVTEWVMLPRVNRKNSCFPSSGAGIMEYFLSPSFLVSFSVKVTIWGGGGRGNFQIPNPKDLEAFGGEACVRLSCWGAGRRRAHRWRRLGMSPVIWDILIQPVHFWNLNWLVAVARPSCLHPSSQQDSFKGQLSVNICWGHYNTDQHRIPT